MDYTTAKPHALTATEARLLDCIRVAGWWSVDPKCQSLEQQETLEFLWRCGYIERKSFGGWGVKGQGTYTPARPVACDDLAAVEYIAIPSHKRSALVKMCDGTTLRFKVSDAKYLTGLVALAKAQGRPEAASYTGVLIYRVKVA